MTDEKTLHDFSLTCPICLLEATTIQSLIDRPPPKAGDMMLCTKCYEPSFFEGKGKDLKLRKAKKEEREEVLADPEISGYLKQSKEYFEKSVPLDTSPIKLIDLIRSGEELIFNNGQQAEYENAIYLEFTADFQKAQDMKLERFIEFSAEYHASTGVDIRSKILLMRAQEGRAAMFFEICVQYFVFVHSGKWREVTTELGFTIVKPFIKS